MNTFKRYLHLYKILASQFLKTIMQSKVDFLMGLMGFFFTQIMGIAFLYLVFEQIPSLNGWTLDQLIFIYGFAQIPRGIDHLFTDNIWMIAWRIVLNGDFDRYMLRPMNLFFQVIAERLQPDALGETVNRNHTCDLFSFKGYCNCRSTSCRSVHPVHFCRSNYLYLYQTIFCLHCILGKNQWTIFTGCL